MNSIKKIGVMTGGGDCPGLNAVIRAIVKTAVNKYGLEVVGIKNGYRGLYLGDGQMIPLGEDDVTNIVHKGGTILHNSNKDNLFKYPVRKNGELLRDEAGFVIYEDLSDIAIDNLKKAGIDALVVIGGDGTLTSARDYWHKGVKVVGVPKTIDNDLRATDVTFGFDTAVDRCVEALDCLRTTGDSHHRIMVLEVMGRYAGHIALQTGIAGGADVVLIPEIDYDFDKVVNSVKESLKRGRQFALVVVAEGAPDPTGKLAVNIKTDVAPDGIKLGGVGNTIAKAIEATINSHRNADGFAIDEVIMDVEARATVLSHVQRGGSPSSFDRVLCTRYGSYAVDALMQGAFGSMVALRDNELTTVSLDEVLPKSDADSNFRPVDPESELVKLAKTMGVCFGD